uniref:Uncharacterized protein n=2 Tax=Nicotiana TaxID=4085 RepID=A0A1S4C167_TOBAC|nr:PREDICTED: uncharacterized protein LOC104222643 [Nicotiana sylvestris]XP_016494900.1 PREDICTED: uncharacterized protein LOC107814083 [Nicotiana tabacum]
MTTLSRGLVIFMVIVAAIQFCSHRQVTADAAAVTATGTISREEPCSTEAKAQIEECLNYETGDMDKCCPILHKVIDNSCPCWVHAKIADRQLAILYFTYCDIVHPLCSSAHEAI